METLCPSVQSSGEAARDEYRGRHPARFFTRSATSAQVELPQAAGALAACCLWYTGIGGQSFPLSTLPAPTLGASLLRQPALSALPGRQKLAMVRQADTESLTDQLLPLRLHSTGGTQFSDASQPAQTLPALVRLRRTESAGVRTQPTRGAISESPPSYIPGDRSSTSIPISTALLPAEH